MITLFELITLWVNLVMPYLVKVLVSYSLGPFFFVAALLIFPFDNLASRRIFNYYLQLSLKIFEVKVRFQLDDPEIKTIRNAVFIILNQASFLDTLICPIFPLPPGKAIINIEFALYPVIGWYSSLWSFVIVRQWSAQAKAGLNKADKYLQKGGNVLISIEGKRSKDGNLNTYKKGPVVMALHNQSTIVPVIIYGSRDCLPVGSLRVKPGSVQVRFFKPISTKGLTYENRNELIDQLYTLAKTNSQQTQDPKV